MDNIARKWNEYKNGVLADVDLTGRDELLEETLFFAGGAAMLGIIHDLFTSETPPGDIVDRLKELHAELRDFQEAADNIVI